GWEAGPFEMIDMIGASNIGIESKKFYQSGEILNFSGAYVPTPAEPEYRRLADYPLVDQREGFNVRDLGDGVLSVGLTTKMGVINPAVVDSLTEFLSGDD